VRDTRHAKVSSRDITIENYPGSGLLKPPTRRFQKNNHPRVAESTHTGVPSRHDHRAQRDLLSRRWDNFDSGTPRLSSHSFGALLAKDAKRAESGAQALETWGKLVTKPCSAPMISYT
jgi:hypothetical protein